MVASKGLTAPDFYMDNLRLPDEVVLRLLVGVPVIYLRRMVTACYDSEILSRTFYKTN